MSDHPTGPRLVVPGQEAIITPTGIPEVINDATWIEARKMIRTLMVNYERTNRREYEVMYRLVAESVDAGRRVGLSDGVIGAAIVYQLNVTAGCNVQGLLALVMDVMS